MIGNAKMQKLVSHNKILETHGLLSQICCECYRAGGRTRSPFPGHPLYSNDTRLYPELTSPIHSASL
jgi:hypothetical protein